MPRPNKNESKDAFISRCMSSEKSKKTFPDHTQRVAFCYSQWSNKTKGVFVYRNPRTNELHYFEKRGVYKKDGKTLVFVGERSMSQEHIINEVDETYKQSLSDDLAGYPPNCNSGYVEKDGKCVPKDSDGE
tara:strand:+ start:545 stop:937 length:393 start_codon:yes stop_codon:yes gene_type:complete